MSPSLFLTFPFRPSILTSNMTRALKLMISRRRRANGKNSFQYTMTIPSAIVEAFSWDETTRLEISIEGKGILRVREAKG